MEAIHEYVLYMAIGLFSIIGYLAKGKIESNDQNYKDLSLRLDKHVDSDNEIHLKVIETYVTRADYTQTVGRIFDMLTGIANDIKGLLTSKADRE